MSCLCAVIIADEQRAKIAFVLNSGAIGDEEEQNANAMIYTYVYVCVCVQLQNAYSQKHTHTVMYESTYICTYTIYVYKSIHTYIHMYICYWKTCTGIIHNEHKSIMQYIFGLKKRGRLEWMMSCRGKLKSYWRLAMPKLCDLKWSKGRSARTHTWEFHVKNR